MKYLFIIAMGIALVGCNDTTSMGKTENRQIRVYQDHDYNVTCWTYITYREGSISCIPNDQLKKGI